VCQTEAVILSGSNRRFLTALTYTYSGNFFSYHDDLSCPPDCAISGSFTVSSALGHNFKGFIVPTSFSFTDGNLTISSGETLSPFSGFFVDTNSTGEITRWGIVLRLPNGDSLLSTDFGLLIADGSIIKDGWHDVDVAGNIRDAGTWSTPEPSALLLLSISLAGLFAVATLGPFLRR
jgi:hypothetical protein